MSSAASTARRVRDAVATGIESYLGRFLLWIVGVLLVVWIYSRQTAPASAWTADDWSALASIVTASIALLALVIALFYWHDAQATRQERRLPYVVASLEPDRSDPRVVYLVIRNLGATPAHDVRIEMTPSPVRSNGAGGGELPYPTDFPVLVPGQTSRTFWDFGPWRYHQRDVLEARHRMRIEYDDSRSQPHETESWLDWDSVLLGPGWIGRRPLDDVSNHIESMERSLRRLAGTAPEDDGVAADGSVPTRGSEH